MGSKKYYLPFNHILTSSWSSSYFKTNAKCVGLHIRHYTRSRQFDLHKYNSKISQCHLHLGKSRVSVTFLAYRAPLSSRSSPHEIFYEVGCASSSENSLDESLEQHPSASNSTFSPVDSKHPKPRTR